MYYFILYIYYNKKKEIYYINIIYKERKKNVKIISFLKIFFVFL